MTVRFETKKSMEPVSSENVDESRASRQDTKKATGTTNVLERPSALAQRVPGQNNLGQFARQSPSARFDHVTRTLTAHPERADALIEERLRGWSSTDRSIVRAAVAERGNVGLKRYADAEAALRDLGKFSPDERGDILGIMRAGASFRQAIGDERRALAAPTPARQFASAAALREQAVANVREEAKEMAELGRKVGVLVRQIGSSARAAELVAGAGSGAGLLGSAGWKTAKAAATGSTEPLKSLVDGAGDAGEMMVAGATGKGGRSGRIAAAEQTARHFFAAGERHTAARTRFEQAARGGDYGAMTQAKRDLDSAAAEMRAHARRLEPQVAAIAKWDANLAKGGVAAGMSIASVSGAGLPDKLADAVIDRALDAAVDEAADFATKPSTAR